jgi:hypothetical protein
VTAATSSCAAGGAPLPVRPRPAVSFAVSDDVF